MMKKICQKIRTILQEMIIPFFIRLFKPDSARQEHKTYSSEEIPDIPQLEEELEREKHKKRYGTTLKSTIFAQVLVLPQFKLGF